MTYPVTVRFYNLKGAEVQTPITARLSVDAGSREDVLVLFRDFTVLFKPDGFSVEYTVGDAE